MNRKIIAALLLVSALFALAGCGAQAQTEPQMADPTPAAETAAPTPEMQSVLPGSNLSSGTQSAPADEQGKLDEAKLEEAMKYIDHDVSELYAAIGEPLDSSYASSCIGPGDDGELYYEGFTVATYREGDRETVRDVNVDAG